ncbi:STAS domain-containing protein [Ideonella sp. A 288]|uniref:STAS domain-containing protein n=1 Tax=Ideonella sp. A 288 TaxID=1962181 RepID=UPI000B4B38CC|nr:STAS domain-containing protein [Ideonella sp. A 288]
MAEPKDGESFFRKVVKFVANPATEWSDAGTKQDDPSDAELEKSELKAMVERKRRNDFVRKRELDMLRRLRREGLSPEQLAALGGSSRIDDTDVRVSETGIRQDIRVKAKIDEIEQQMVGEGFRNTGTKRSSTFFNAPTEALAFDAGNRAPAPGPGRSAGNPAVVAREDRLPALPPLPNFDQMPSGVPAPVTMGAGMAPLKSPAAAPAKAIKPTQPPMLLDSAAEVAIEVSEVVHDPELDEAVIAFANADFNHCEHALTQLVVPGAPRYEHGETWHVLFDLYRAIGQQVKFESLSLEYAQLFGSSSPQWFSLPRMVADAAAAEEPSSAPRPIGNVGWVSPAALDTDAVARLRSTALQLPLPWVLDWSALQQVDVEAASQLTVLFQQWSRQRVEMRWLSGDLLFSALHEAAPTGTRDADPAYWMARLEALRLANRPDQFDEAAIDYCMTYEVSPPSWERAECVVRVSGASTSTASPPMSIVSEVSTGFLESSLLDDPNGTQVATVELSGQLVGDISATLTKLDQRLGSASLVSVSCARLIRVDFIAAGDLLNWVLAKRGQERAVTFTEAHRLVALFFGAMGINEHARVQVRRD